MAYGADDAVVTLTPDERMHAALALHIAAGDGTIDPDDAARLAVKMYGGTPEIGHSNGVDAVSFPENKEPYRVLLSSEEMSLFEIAMLSRLGKSNTDPALRDEAKLLSKIEDAHLHGARPQWTMDFDAESRTVEKMIHDASDDRVGYHPAGRHLEKGVYALDRQNNPAFILVDHDEAGKLHACEISKERAGKLSKERQYQNGWVDRTSLVGDGVVVRQKCHLRDGALDNVDGPAVQAECDIKKYAGSEYFRDGKLHRADGPAVERADGSREWHVNGEKTSDGAFNRRTLTLLLRYEGNEPAYVSSRLFEAAKRSVDGPAKGDLIISVTKSDALRAMSILSGESREGLLASSGAVQLMVWGNDALRTMNVDGEPVDQLAWIAEMTDGTAGSGREGSKPGEPRGRVFMDVEKLCRNIDGLPDPGRKIRSICDAVRGTSEVMSGTS